MHIYTYILLWFVSNLAAYAASINGASLANGVSQLMKRAPKEAGIGVEIEDRQFRLANNDPRANNADEKMRTAVKGSTLINAEGNRDLSTTCARYWDLTAEYQGVEGTGKS
jgi:hypothetical protein